MMIYQQRCVRQGWHALQRRIFNVPFHGKSLTTTASSRNAISTEIIRPSANNSRLPCIQKLLYQAYIREQKWKFGIKNPSGIWVDDEKELFHDNFMKSSTWIVVKTSQDEIIGCSRLIEDADAEIFGYLGWSSTGANAIGQVLEKFGPGGVIEMNRLAVSAKARTPDIKVGTDLVVGAFRHLSLGGVGDDRPLIATAAVNSWVPNFMNHIPGVGEIAEKLGEPFRYEDSDPKPVQMFVFPRELIRKSAEKYR